MKTKLFLLAIAVVLLAACNTTMDCPGFPDYLMDYYPYKTGDTLKFVNQNNDTIYFNIESIRKTEAYTESCNCACENSFGFITASEKKYYSYMSGYIYAEAGTSVSESWMHLHLSGTDLFANAPGKNAFNPQDSLLFGKVVTLHKEQPQKINNVVIEKGKGITEFLDTENTPNYLWKKIN